MEYLNTHKCKSCGAEIFWTKTIRGKNVPLDAAPVPDGNIVIKDGVAIIHAPPELGPRFKSHFATCPQAAQHRRK